MASTIHTITLTASLTLGAALLGGCNHTPSHSQVSWQQDAAPHIDQQNQSWWNYQFVYFPASQVYFEPHGKTFYWFEQGVWRQGSQLPQHVTLQNESPSVVKLSSEQPFMQHQSVTSAFLTNHQPIPGSDFTKSQPTFTAYLNRHQAAQHDFQLQQWAMNGENIGPVGSPFNPFSSPLHGVWGTGTATANAGQSQFNNSQYTSGSKEYHNSVNEFLNTSTAEAHSDQPDF